MATCKECLSYEMCAVKGIVEDAFEDELAKEWYEVCADACEHFKDKTKYAEQKHGRWEEADDGDGVVCSVCREDFCNIYLETDRFNYCPNCGARMDGDT